MPIRIRCAAAAILAVASSLYGADDPLKKLLDTPVSTGTAYEHQLSSTTAKYDQELSNTPAAVTIITADEIERYGWTSLDQVLQSVPGFYVTNDRNYTYLGVRGIGRPTDYNERVLVLLDGHQLNTSVIGGAPIGSDLAVDLRTVERIEIIRGPGSAVYGSHAMNAAINIITQTAEESDGLAADVTAGSSGRIGSGLHFGKIVGHGWQVTASGLWENVDGADLRFPEYHGAAHGRDYEYRYGFAAGVHNRDFSLTARRYSRTKGIPTGSYDSLFDVDSRTTDWNDMLAADYHRSLGAKLGIDVRADWNREGEHGIWPYDPAPGIDDTHAVRRDGEAHLHWDVRSNQRLTAGVEYAKVSPAVYRFDVGDFHKYLAIPYDMTSYYAEYEYHPLPQFGITAGLRRDDFSATADSTNPRLALLFTPTARDTVKLLYGRAFRSPNIYETFYADPVTPWKANPELAPEHVHTAELEWGRRLSPEVFATASLYHTGFHDLIEQQLDPADGTYMYGNDQHPMRTTGGDLRVDLRRKDGLWAYVSYSFVRAMEQYEGRVDNAPEQMIKAGISTSPEARFHAGLDGIFESSRLTRDGKKTDPYLLLNATATWQFQEHLRAGVTIRNLLNAGYATPVGPELRQESLRQDGRTLAFHLTFTR